MDETLPSDQTSLLYRSLHQQFEQNTSVRPNLPAIQISTSAVWTKHFRPTKPPCYTDLYISSLNKTLPSDQTSLLYRSLHQQFGRNTFVQPNLPAIQISTSAVWTKHFRPTKPPCYTDLYISSLNKTLPSDQTSLLYRSLHQQFGRNTSVQPNLPAIQISTSAVWTKHFRPTKPPCYIDLYISSLDETLPSNQTSLLYRSLHQQFEQNTSVRPTLPVIQISTSAVWTKHFRPTKPPCYTDLYISNLDETLPSDQTSLLYRSLHQQFEQNTSVRPNLPAIQISISAVWTKHFRPTKPPCYTDLYISSLDETLPSDQTSLLYRSLHQQFGRNTSIRPNLPAIQISTSAVWTKHFRPTKPPCYTDLYISSLDETLPSNQTSLLYRSLQSAVETHSLAT